MSALPRKHPTGRQKLKKSNRVYPRYDRDEERLRKRKIGQRGQQNQGQSLQAKPQMGWTAQQPQNQRPPISKWWWIVIIAIIIIFVSIISSTLKNLNNLSQGTDNGNVNNGNDCTCYCGDGNICTKNSDCLADTSVPGTSVPGVCGCPVGC